MNDSKTMKLLLAASAGLLAASTQASNLKIDETGTTKGDIFKFDNGTWDNVIETVDTSVPGREKFVFEADLTNGKLTSGSKSIALLNANKTVSDVLTASWTLVQDTASKSGDDNEGDDNEGDDDNKGKCHDHFVITLWSDGGWPSVPDKTTLEKDGMTKYLKVGHYGSEDDDEGGGSSAVNIFVNSPESVDPQDPHTATTPDGGMTLAMLGTAVSAVALIRRKLS
jgi:hypothetical protein